MHVESGIRQAGEQEADGAGTDRAGRDRIGTDRVAEGRGAHMDVAKGSEDVKGDRSLGGGSGAGPAGPRQSGLGSAPEGAGQRSYAGPGRARASAQSGAGSRGSTDGISAGSSGGYSGSLESDKELEEIFRRTYGDSKRQRSQREQSAPGGSLSGRKALRERAWQPTEPLEEYLLVDGYNVIFAWDSLKELAKVSLDGARQRLMDILCNYQGFKKCHVILVFDAYRVAGHACEVREYLNIHVVYTKEAETADRYIEKTVHELAKKYRVTVATSDGLEQIIIMGQGALRMSAAELLEEVERTDATIRAEYLDKPRRKQNLLFEGVDEETAAYVKDVGGGISRGAVMGTGSFQKGG